MYEIYMFVQKSKPNMFMSSSYVLQNLLADSEQSRYFSYFFMVKEIQQERLALSYKVKSYHKILLKHLSLYYVMKY